VTVVEMMPNILPVEDTEVSQALEKSLAKQGIKILTGTKVDKAETTNKGVRLTVSGKTTETLEADIALVAIGVSPLMPKGVNLVSVFPGCTYCQPQVASVGLTERAAKEKGLKFKVGKFPFMASGKALAVGESDGFVKLLVGEKHGEILGAHIIGADATEMIAELGLAITMEATYEEIIATIHAHPTLSEAVHEAAHASQGHAIHF